MPQQSEPGRKMDIHLWRAGYRAYVDGRPFTDAPSPPERDDWISGYVRARTDRARVQAQGGEHEAGEGVAGEERQP